MNVLVVNPLVDPATGGMSRKSVTIVRALRNRGLGCAYLTTNVDLSAQRPPALADLDITVLPALFERFNLPLPSARNRRAVAELVDAADVVMLMNHWAMLNALAYRAARRAGKPFVLLPGGALPAHGRSRRLKYLFNAAVGTGIIDDAAAIVATTSLEAQDLMRCGIREDRITIIPNAVSEELDADADGAAFRVRYGLGDAPFVLFAGRLHTVKGPDLLLSAFERVAAQLPSVHLVLAGANDGLGAALEQQVAANGVRDRVHLVGRLDRCDLAAAYRATTLLAVTSRKEAMSLVAIEAGLMGLPLILTDTCGFNEVEEVGGGRVVPATIEGIAAGLVDLLRDLAANPDRLPAMGRRLQAFVKERYTWARIAPMYEAVLEQAQMRGSVTSSCD